MLKPISFSSTVLIILIFTYAFSSGTSPVYSVTLNQYELPWHPWKAPRGLKVDSEEMVWFTESEDGNAIGRFNLSDRGNPVTKGYKEFTIPTANAKPYDLAFDSAGNVWFTEFDGNKIGRLNPNTGVINEYAIPTLSSKPYGIDVDDFDNVWFTESQGNKIGKRSPSGTITEYPIPRLNSNSKYLVVGPQGKVWFAMTNSPGVIAVLDPVTSVITEFQAPTVNCVPNGITVDHLGYIWFTEHYVNKIARFDPSTHIFREYSIPYAPNDPPNPWLLTEAPDGSIWFSGEQQNAPDGVGEAGRLDPELGIFEIYKIPKPPLGDTPHNHPKGIDADRSGNIWVACWDTDYLTQLQDAFAPAKAWVSGGVQTVMPIIGALSSGPHGDQSTSNTTFVPSLESIEINATGSSTYLLVGTSQVWDSTSSIGASIAICRDGFRISGDMFARGATINHRHFATAIALDTPTAGNHNYTLSFKTDSGGSAYISATYMIAVPVNAASQSGPHGDQSTISTIFNNSAESIIVNVNPGDKLLVVASSQLWNSKSEVGSSMCISRNGSRISGDMFGVGATIMHRHAATAIALDSPPPGIYRYTLQFKTNLGGQAWVSGTYLIVIPLSSSNSSGPYGDESTTSKTFTPTSVSNTMEADGSTTYMIFATSQLWNNLFNVGSSIAICRDGQRISGDQFSLGPIITHRHLACAIAIDTPDAGDHQYALCSKTD